MRGTPVSVLFWVTHSLFLVRWRLISYPHYSVLKVRSTLWKSRCTPEWGCHHCQLLLRGWRQTPEEWAWSMEAFLNRCPFPQCPRQINKYAVFRSRQIARLISAADCTKRYSISLSLLLAVSHIPFLILKANWSWWNCHLMHRGYYSSHACQSTH